jgi:hypothetical protein
MIEEIRKEINSIKDSINTIYIIQQQINHIKSDLRYINDRI